MVSDPHSHPVDLHTHTTASDGTLTPKELVAAAVRLGLGAIAITDHDTLAGVREVLADPVPPEIKFLPGVEISAAPPEGFPVSGSLHILGYRVDPDHTGLSALLSVLQKAREDRNPQMIRKLQDLGVAITMEEVETEAGEGLLGRPHIARVLIRNGAVSDIEEAFGRYLGKGKAAYVDKYRAPWAEAIRAIRDAGGVAVLAHPGLIGELDANGVRQLLSTLKTAGLQGVEVFYSEHDAQKTKELAEMASDLDLIATGGSDFHGGLKDGIHLGTGRGDLFVPYHIYESIMRA